MNFLLHFDEYVLQLCSAHRIHRYCTNTTRAGRRNTKYTNCTRVEKRLRRRETLERLVSLRVSSPLTPPKLSRARRRRRVSDIAIISFWYPRDDKYFRFACIRHLQDVLSLVGSLRADIFQQRRDRIGARQLNDTVFVDSSERLTGRRGAKTKINFHIRMLYWSWPCLRITHSLAAEGPFRCVMRDFIAVTGIGRGHRAHALSPRFCLTDYFIYGHRVYTAAGASVVAVCAASSTKERLQN